MTYAEWINEASLRLAGAGIESSKLEAQLLAGAGCGHPRAWLITHANDTINDVDKIDWLLARRLEREPLSYILGYREFFGRRFLVSESVLIPRQETETVVEEGLSWIVTGDTVLDVGVGSGAIAVTLALESSGTVYGSDISSDAIWVAQKNARVLGADVKLLTSDLTSSISSRAFDVVLSNPPYIAKDEVLEPEVVCYEPHLALYASDRGTSLYKRLAKEAKRVVKKVLIVEVAAGQADAIRSIFEIEGWTYVHSRRDLIGHERALTFHPPG